MRLPVFYIRYTVLAAAASQTHRHVAAGVELRSAATLKICTLNLHLCLMAHLLLLLLPLYFS
jgi:hypothetical protein